MKNIATAYNARRYAHGGKVKGPKLMASPEIHRSSELPEEEDELAKGGMCAHGGPIKCAMGCYDEGGEVHDAEGFSDNDDDLFDESGEQSRFDAEFHDRDANLDGDVDSSIDHEDASEGTRKYAKGGMIMSKLLGRIMKAHRGH